MDIKDLRIFARVAAVQNLSAVAVELGCSAGTISKRMQALEDEVGVRLIDRTTRSSRLTEEGRTFLGRVERILAEIDHAQDEIKAASGAPSGRLKISAPASLARQLALPALLSFSEAYPAIEVCIDITDRIVNLHDEGYDAAIRAGELPDSTLKAKRLAGDRTILVAAPGYIEKHGAPQRPSDIARHHALAHADQRAWTFLKTGGGEEEVRIVSRLGSDSGDLLQQAVLQGVGLLRTSEIAVMEDIAAGRLIRLMPEYELATEAAIWVVYPNAKHPMPRLRALLDHLAEFCRERLNPTLRQSGRMQVPLDGARRPQPVSDLADESFALRAARNKG
jgi:DNA-binding transcriptional LysR family regulator